MVMTKKKDFTKEVKTAYRNSVDGDAGLLLGLIMEITAGNRGKLFVLRAKDGNPIYSYYISPSALNSGNVRDSHNIEKTIQLSMSEAKVTRTIIEKIQEYRLANIGACVVIENLTTATFDYLKPFVTAIFDYWDAEFRSSTFDQLKAVLYGDVKLKSVIMSLRNRLQGQLPEIVALYRDIFGEDLAVSDVEDDALTNIAKAIVWYIEQEYGAEF